MTVTVFPVTQDFFAEVGDVDLSRPLDSADFKAIQEAFWKYAVLVFPDQKLTPEQHLEFARSFGPLVNKLKVYREGNRERTHREIEDISNLDLDNEIKKTDNRIRLMRLANRLWHTDATFKQVPAKISLLYGREIPPIGGQTEYADTRAAYDALPEGMKLRLKGLVAEHSFRASRARVGFTDFSEEEKASLPPVRQVMVRTTPESGRKSLYVASHIGRVLGLPQEESDALVDDLIAHASQRQFVHTHRWRQFDLVMWDDRCTMHRGLAYDDERWRRDVQRATVSEAANSCELEGVSIATLNLHGIPQ
jgi:alpha-ketoglutarate-dependent 2,4-dichlorophenoxyacetate dioxygenase